MLGKKPCRVRPVLSRLSVADRIHDVAVLAVPRGRRSMQFRDGASIRAAQLQPQQVTEELVAAEPRTVGVERDDECVLLLERVEDALRTRAAEKGIGQRPVHAVKDGSPQQQPLHLVGLPFEHFGKQVVRDRAIAAGESGDESIRVRVAGERKSGEPQPRRPSLRPRMKPGDGLVGQLDPRRGKQLVRLLEGETQIGVSNLDQFSCKT